MKDLVQSYLENKSLEKIADYVQRGRRFSTCSLDELRTKWCDAFKQYVASGISSESDDYEAELSLRREPIPLELVQKEWDSLQEKINAVLNDPQARNRVGKGIVHDLLEFSRSGAKIDKS